MPLSRSYVDALVDQARTKVAELGGRLFDLDAELQRGASRAARLQGPSAAAWEGAQDQVSVMWAWYQAASQVIASIAARLQSAGLDRRELESLWSELTGPTVQLPAESMELAGRCLPEAVAASSTWTLEPLIELMSKVIAAATETVTSMVAIGEMASSKLGEIAASLSHSEAIARRAGCRVPNGAAPIRDRVHALEEQLATDPMAVPLDSVAALSTAAARLAQEVDAAVAEVSGIDEALDRICVDFEAGIDDLARARQDLAEVKIKIARPLAAPTMTDADDLASQLHQTGLGLDEARRQATSGDRASAVRLAAALGPAAAALRAAAHALAASAGASLARRRELRGRLDAYRSKAYGLGRAEDPTLIELYRLTQDSLYHAPCDLDEAERRLIRYQNGVLGGGGPSDGPNHQTADAARLVGPSPDASSGSWPSRSSPRDVRDAASPAMPSRRAEGRDEHEM